MVDRILVLGGSKRPWHQFDEYRDGLEALSQEFAGEVVCSEDLDLLRASEVRGFDIVLCCASQETLTPEQEEGLLGAIAGMNAEETGPAKGFFGFHAASTISSDSGRYNRMLGARFLAHPPAGDPVPVEVVDPANPLSAGVSDFSIADELYLQDYYGRFDTALESTWRGIRVPLAWTKGYGLGRVACCALGHAREQLEEQPLQQLVRNALGWLSQ